MLLSDSCRIIVTLQLTKIHPCSGVVPGESTLHLHLDVRKKLIEIRQNDGMGTPRFFPLRIISVRPKSIQDNLMHTEPHLCEAASSSAVIWSLSCASSGGRPGDRAASLCTVFKRCQNVWHRLKPAYVHVIRTKIPYRPLGNFSEHRGRREVRMKTGQ